MANTVEGNGRITGGTMQLVGGNPAQGIAWMIPEHAKFTMMHELGHAQGLNDVYDSGANGKSVMFGGYNLSAPTQCDALFVHRVAREKVGGFLADPCIGRLSCLGNGNLQMCLWGGPARNGNCFPTWMTEPLKGDVRFRVGSGNWQSFGAINSPSSVGPSGTIGLQAIDPDGKVMRVDWYVNGQFVYTALEDPFGLPYSGAGPGTYTIQAQMWDDRLATSWTAPASITIVAGGGGGGGGGCCSGGHLAPGQRLYSDQRVYSSNGSYYLTHQSDGNLVLYGPSGPVWASMYTAPGGYTEMQTDGNLVSYAPGPYWATMSSSSGAWLAVQNDGNLVIYSSSGAVVCGVNALQPGQQCP